jgi:hypothetical protein
MEQVSDDYAIHLNRWWGQFLEADLEQQGAAITLSMCAERRAAALAQLRADGRSTAQIAAATGLTGRRVQQLTARDRRDTYMDNDATVHVAATSDVKCREMVEHRRTQGWFGYAFGYGFNCLRAHHHVRSSSRLIRHARRETEHAAELLQGARRHPARESYDSRVRNLRAVALFAATGASVALIGAPIAAADNGPGQPQCSGPPGACPTYGNAPINNSPPTRPPAFFVPYDGARYPYGN